MKKLVACVTRGRKFDISKILGLPQQQRCSHLGRQAQHQGVEMINVQVKKAPKPVKCADMQGGYLGQAEDM